MTKETLRKIANGNKKIYWNEMINNVPVLAGGFVLSVNENSIKVMGTYEKVYTENFTTEFYYNQEYETYTNSDSSNICIYTYNDYEPVVGNLYEIKNEKPISYKPEIEIGSYVTWKNNIGERFYGNVSKICKKSIHVKPEIGYGKETWIFYDNYVGLATKDKIALRWAESDIPVESTL